MTFAIWTVCQFAMPSLLAPGRQLHFFLFAVTAPSTKLWGVTQFLFVEFLRSTAH